MGGQLEDHGPAYGLVEVCGILTRSKLSSKWGPPSGAKKSQLHEEHTNKPMKKNDRSETSQNDRPSNPKSFWPFPLFDLGVHSIQGVIFLTNRG